MNTVSQTIAADVDSLERKVLERLQLFNETLHHPHNPLIRLEIECAELALLPLLKQTAFETSFYWRSRDQHHICLGLGVADKKVQDAHSNVAGFLTEIKSILNLNPQSRYFGGMSFFNEAYENSAWSAFGVYHFVLPRFEFTQAERTTLAVQVLLSKNTDIVTLQSEIRADFERLKASISQFPCIAPILTQKTYSPNLEAWTKAITVAKQEMKENTYQKIVLARKTSFQLDNDASSVDVFNAIQPFSERAYAFYFQPTFNAAFMSISPERLYKRTQNKIETEAIAGTRAGLETDETIAMALSQSPKAQAEHHHVVTMIQETLKPLCQSLTVDKQEVLKLRYVQHLKDHLSGTLNPFVDDAQIIKALHPTPAVGGYPRDITQIMLKSREPFERGWYAGLFGWFGAQESELAVGIRSARCMGKHLDVFTGAGIVADSDPQEEWQELEDKMYPFTNTQ